MPGSAPRLVRIGWRDEDGVGYHNDVHFRPVARQLPSRALFISRNYALSRIKIDKVSTVNPGYEARAKNVPSLQSRLPRAGLAFCKSRSFGRRTKHGHQRTLLTS